MLEALISGTLVQVIVSMGRWLAVAATSPRGKIKHDAEIAKWFDTYKLTESPPEFPELTSETSEALGDALQSNQVQASLHELLAVRLTDAPEVDVESVRLSFNAAVYDSLGNTVPTEIPDMLFAYYDSQICELVGRLQGGLPTAYQQLRQNAFGARIVAILNALQVNVSTLTGRVSPQETYRYLTSYLSHVRERHGKIQPPDYQRRQRIPIEELYVSPTTTLVSDTSFVRGRSRSQRVAEYAREQSAIGEPENSQIPFEELAAKIDRTVLLGNPGGGKSTTSNVLMYRNALETKGNIPFLVVLREFASESPLSRSVVGYIEYKLETLYQCPAPNGLISRLLLAGQALVIFDGLDELIDTSRRSEVTEVVEHFCIEYPLAKVLVTSRLVGYDQARLDDKQFTCYQLSGFATKQIEEYVTKWFAQDEELGPADAARRVQSFMEESGGAQDLRSNPLMLALMCIIYYGEGYIPQNRPEVYEQCSELLFRKWDAQRQIKVELRAHNLIESALRHLAYWLFTRDSAELVVPERELIRETASFLHGRGFENEEDAEAASREFVEFCRGRAWVFSDAGITASGDTLYTFTHRTFLEYFAAAHLAMTTDTPAQLARILLPRVAKAEWEVVAELAVQKKDDITDRGAERVISAMLNDGRRRSYIGRSNILEFLARCILFTRVAPQIMREVTARAFSLMQSDNPAEAARYGPLARLLESPIDRRDLIAGELERLLDIMIRSADPKVHRLGLLIAGNLEDAVNYSETDSRRIAVDYWKAFTRNMRERYAAAIIDASNDIELMAMALTFRMVDLRYVLTQGTIGLDFVVRFLETGVFNSGWGSYSVTLAEAIFTQSDHIIYSGKLSYADALDDLAAIGEYVMRSSAVLPYAIEIGPDDFSPPFTTKSFAARQIILDPIPYLGFVIIVCINLEIGNDWRGLPWESHFPEFAPYVAQRFTIDAKFILPELPVPAGFETLIKNWASRIIDFTTQGG